MEVESRIDADYKMETFFKIYMDYKVAMNDSMDGAQEMEIDYEIEVGNKKELEHKMEKEAVQYEEAVQDEEAIHDKELPHDKEHNQELHHKTNMLLGHIALDHACSSIASLAYQLFIYRAELGHRNSNALQLTQMKIDITAKLIMNCAGRISECGTADIDAFTRLFTFKEFLAEQKWILSGGLSNDLGIKDVDDFDFEDFDWS